MMYVLVLLAIVVVFRCVQWLLDPSRISRTSLAASPADRIESMALAEARGLGIRHIHPVTRLQRRRRLIRSVITSALILVYAAVAQVLPSQLTIILAAIAGGIFTSFSAFHVFRLRPAGAIGRGTAATSRVCGIAVTLAFNTFGMWMILHAADYVEASWASPIGVALIIGGLILLNSATSPARVIERNFVTYAARLPRGATAESVYLRPFSETRIQRIAWAGAERGPISSLLRGGYTSFEEFLGTLITASGPTITLARTHGRELPLLRRPSWALLDDQWDLVAPRLLREARYIYLVAGPTYVHVPPGGGVVTTSGQYFEVSRLRAWGLLHKCLFVLPPERRDEAGLSIESFCDELGLDTTPIQHIPVETIVGFTISATGRLVAYIDSGNDWQTYPTLIDTFRNHISGREDPPSHGHWAEFADLSTGLTKQ
ncbi:hypothetical protein [Gordonia bronchialis]|uniref:hypothetical protein n=1 Tax=Gordonia bronchialis TaxID=2054 RepID=UPI00243017A8|nr:hypothetical protein [Gordonia bronchialis]